MMRSKSRDILFINMTPSSERGIKALLTNTLLLAGFISGFIYAESVQNIDLQNLLRFCFIFSLSTTWLIYKNSHASVERIILTRKAILQENASVIFLHNNSLNISTKAIHRIDNETGSRTVFITTNKDESHCLIFSSSKAAESFMTTAQLNFQHIDINGDVSQAITA